MSVGITRAESQTCIYGSEEHQASFEKKAINKIKDRVEKKN
jgi:hypothetical protein